MGSAWWYLGLVVAFVFVFVVVVCVATILNLARRISVQARELSVALNASGTNTDVLHALPAVNDMITTVYGGVAGVRTKLFGGA